MTHGEGVLARDIHVRIASAIGAATRGACRLESVDVQERCLTTAFTSAEGVVTIEVRPTTVGKPAYRVVGELSFGYRSGTERPSATKMRLIDAAVGALAFVLSQLDGDVFALLAADDAEDAAHFPLPHHRAHLESEQPPSRETIDTYRRDGHVLIRRALEPALVRAAEPLLRAALRRRWPSEARSIEERLDAYSQSFLQVTNMARVDEIVRTFAHSRRIGRIAADLMGVSGVRVYCEDWLIKEPGSRITPWHQDAAVYAFDAQATISVWIPIHPIASGMGLLRFARGSQRLGLADVENINDVSERAFDALIAEHHLVVDDLPPMYVGDVSFHDGLTVHGAHPNTSGEHRIVLALHCFADGAVVKAPTTETMRRLHHDFAPELAPGDPAACAGWPLIYDARDPSAGRPAARTKGRPLHLRATLVPGGSAPVDLWIVDGRIRREPVASAEELAPAGGFVTNGLVDCHSHISWPHDRETPAHTAAFIDANRRLHSRTGVTLLRDMGSADDAILALPEQPGLPRVQASGMLVLPHDEFPFTPTTPANLCRAFEARLEKGARWVKVFTDWSRDYDGKWNTGFTGEDDVTYPLDVLSEAVVIAHAAGARVGAHCFSRGGAEVAIEAGVDALEHGWGVDEALVARMAERRVAWVPLVGLAPAMWRTAWRDDQPTRAAWIELSMERLRRWIPEAHRRGVGIFAGTDWFPEVTVADEIRELCALGLDVETAVGAGAWDARAWMGEPGFEDGAPADLVLYASDPRQTIEALFDPQLILIGGRRVQPSFASVRPSHQTWSQRSRT